MIFLTETKCKIRFIYVGFNCKRKKVGEKCLEICAIKGGGGRRLIAKTILNFHFDYLKASLINCTSICTGVLLLVLVQTLVLVLGRVLTE